MKTVLKWLGLVVLALLLFAGGFAAYVQFRDFPHYDTAVPNLKIEHTPARIERGRHLALSLCAECHHSPETGTLSGTKMLDMPEEFGVAYSRNITNHKTEGIGSWSDGDIAWLLRTGIHPHSGRYLPPWMPKFVHMSDEDVNSIISWLRSDDPLIAATDSRSRDSEPTWFAKFLVTVAFEPFPYPTSPIPQPNTSNLVEYGKYLATAVYDCYGCHSGDIATVDVMVPENTPDFMGGGTRMMDVNGSPIFTPNITFDKTNGIGSWTEEQFVTALKEGFRPDGTLLRYPMPRGAHFDTTEIRALYAYLKSVPQLAKPRSESYTYTAESGASRGKNAYNTYGCTGCHGSTGLGYGNLQNANAKYPDDSTLIAVIKNIRAYYPESSMPVWGGRIPDEEFAPLAAHVRSLAKK